MTRYLKLCSDFDNQKTISLPQCSCSFRQQLQKIMLVNSRNYKRDSKINYIITETIISTTCILIIDLLKIVLVESRRNT